MLENTIEHLKTKGYVSFDLDENDKGTLKEIFSKIKELEFNYAVHTSNKSRQSNNIPFSELENKKEERLNEEMCWQYWYYIPSLRGKIKEEDIAFLNNIVKNIANKFYIESNIEISADDTFTFSMYNKGCFINKHQDGNHKDQITEVGNLCNILLYLNEDYSEECGGELVLNDNDIIKPTFGKIVILDFFYKNPEHRVNKVISDNFKRYALLFRYFFKYKK